MNSAPTVDAEIVDDKAGASATPVNQPQTAIKSGTFFTKGTTLHSPFFWLFAGVAITIGYYEWMRYNDKKKRRND